MPLLRAVLRLTLQPHQRRCHLPLADRASPLTHYSQHFKIHTPKTVPCPRCLKTFISDSALVLHFETNTCPGGLNMTWVDRTAEDCARLPGCHVFLGNGSSDRRYQCTACETGFRLMSALLQHVESEACAEELENGPLTEFAIRCEDGAYRPDESPLLVQPAATTTPAMPIKSLPADSPAAPFSGFSEPPPFVGGVSVPRSRVYCWR